MRVGTETIRLMKRRKIPLTLRIGIMTLSMIRARIRAAIQSGHSSVLNGIDSDKATDKVEALMKDEIATILHRLEMRGLTSWEVMREVILIRGEYGVQKG